MARSRMIRPEFWSDEKLARVSRDARLLFVGLWGASDDYGVVKGHPVWLAGQIFPYDEVRKTQIVGWLKELEGIGRIIKFTASGEIYYHIPKFLLHQRVHNPSKTRNPSPPDGLPKHSESLARHSEEFGSSTETEAETEAETESTQSASPTVVDEIIQDLNQVTGKHFRKCNTTTARIRARIKDGYTVDDFKTVHRNKAAQWKGNAKWDKFLRPSTLYRPGHFEEYLNEKPDLKDDSKPTHFHDNLTDEGRKKYGKGIINQ